MDPPASGDTDTADRPDDAIAQDPVKLFHLYVAEQASVRVRSKDIRFSI